MEENVRLKKINNAEMLAVIDLIYCDEELRNIFNTPHVIKSRLVNSLYVALIKFKNKNIGFIMIVNNPKTNINEIDMGILKDYRNKGYGQIAMGILKNIILENNIKVEIQTNKENDAAISTILHNGFVMFKKDDIYNYYCLPEEEYKRKR